MSKNPETEARQARRRSRIARAATSRCRCAFATASRRSRTGSSLLILQHPQEQDRALGTARLTALHFKNAVLKIGLSWPSLVQGAGPAGADPSRWAVLYLGSAKVADLDTDRDIVAINRKGEIEDNQRAHPEGHRRHRAARRHLEPGQGAVVAQCVDAEVPARHPRPGAAVALRQAAHASRAATACPPSRPRRCCLPAWRSGRISPTTLHASFERMLAKYREAQSVLPELAPKPRPKRDYRRRKRA